MRPMRFVRSLARQDSAPDYCRLAFAKAVSRMQGMHLSSLEGHNKLPGWENESGCIGGERKATLNQNFQSLFVDEG